MHRFHPSALALLLLGALSLLAGSVAAVDYPDKPQGDDFFVDEAGMLDESARATVNTIAKALLSEERIPLFVVTITSLAAHDASGLGIEGYAQSLFDEWGIGSPDRNFGMLLLVSRGDRKARIEFGAGFEHRYDDEAVDIMQSLIVPAFKRGDFSLGIVDGVRGLDAVARGLRLPRPTAPWWFIPLVVVAVIGFGLLVYNLFKRGRSGWAWALIIGLGVLLFFLLRNAGGGSGGGFGGGSSGGGGATGSW